MNKFTTDDPETKSSDIISENIGRLKELFPEAFIEGKIDFEVLKQLLAGVIEEREEKYGLNWHGKRQARQLALTPSTGTLRPCPEDSVDWINTKNLFIEGDNLEVLKLLQKSYANKVKLIYIDPPYNTGKDFIYSDDFRDSIKNYQMLTGQLNSDGRKISSNSEASGRFHTDWLNMIYPRIMLARHLLREDGVIFISIDEAEFKNLKSVCDEVFGEENYIATLIWEKGRKNDAKLISVGHEYMLVVAKNKSYFTANNIKWREAKPGAKEILDEYLRLRSVHKTDNFSIERGIRDFYESLSKTHPSKKHTRYNKVDNKGVWRDDNMSWPGGGGPDYDVIHPVTGKKCAVPEGGWRYSTPEKMDEMIRKGKVIFREDHTEPPIRKTYLVEVDDEQDVGIEEFEASDDSDDLPIQVAGSYFYRSALQSTNELTRLFGKKVFNNPKDHEVLARWISYVGVGQNDIVMDFFAGSGTTGHAVFYLNLIDKKDIHFILVQIPEPIDPKNKASKPAAALLENMGKPFNIAELTKERLRRVIAGIIDDKSQSTSDLGFRVFKLDSSNIHTWDPDQDDIGKTLLDHLEHIRADRSENDILYELLLKLGLDLCVPIETRKISGKLVHAVGAGVLLVCLDMHISQEEAEPLATGIVTWYKELDPAGKATCIFRDSAFADDVTKTNLAAILQQNGLDKVRSL
ncbi:site-specific DNA-methyltransferase [Cohnella fermenti]|uniref:Site-specific DNA-methyltransferase n=1 Tax=Cohnella fermenti TaxID=2565925 RepID=A0A4S4CAI3_9BACL|nr:site-specific DNA-methyltransferase [Cohnella fermenti]THF84448.1 site-specific DNA-methyltransferase [Cohnella fermenti]